MINKPTASACIRNLYKRKLKQLQRQKFEESTKYWDQLVQKQFEQMNKGAELLEKSYELRQQIEEIKQQEADKQKQMIENIYNKIVNKE